MDKDRQQNSNKCAFTTKSKKIF